MEILISLSLVIKYSGSCSKKALHTHTTNYTMIQNWLDNRIIKVINIRVKE